MINPGNSLLYDITSLPSYGPAEILEYGHAKDHPDLEQINLVMVLERSRNIPLFFEIYSGSIPDVVTMKRTVEGIRKHIPKSVFSSASRSVDRADNVIIYQDEPIFCKSVNFTMNDLDLRGYFYHDPGRESDELSDFHRKLAEKRSAVEKLQARPDVMETIESMASTYLRYFTWRMAESRQGQGTMPSPLQRTGWENSCWCIRVNTRHWNAFPYTAIWTALRRHSAY